MKKLYFLFGFLVCALFAQAQCTIVVTHIDVLCFGDCNGMIGASGQGGSAPYTYIWQPGGYTSPFVQGVCAGTYTVTMADAAGCVATATVTVTEPPPLVCTAMNTQQASCPTCCDGIATGMATGGTGAYMYNWLPTGGSTPTATGLCAGTYTFCATDMNNCQCCYTVMVTALTTGLDELADAQKLSVSPNPADDQLFVQSTELPLGEYVLTVTDLLGNVVETRTGVNSAGFRETIDVKGYTPGVYFVSVRSGSRVAVQRFIRE